MFAISSTGVIFRRPIKLQKFDRQEAAEADPLPPPPNTLRGVTRKGWKHRVEQEDRNLPPSNPETFDR
jgi:hypothetical protein